ncbi:hypothetical protein [Halococcus sp. AFM35]|uniref:hypothetical protein n=1 Tax=Halococcus sp. AFM35 TaxID=3421653 RepID=UPI003EBD6B3F
MHRLRAALPVDVRWNSDNMNRTRPDDADRNAESATKRHPVTLIPGIHEHAPRHNALVALVYLLLGVLFVGLFGRLVALVPLPVSFVIAVEPPCVQSSAGTD